MDVSSVVAAPARRAYNTAYRRRYRWVTRNANDRIAQFRVYCSYVMPGMDRGRQTRLFQLLRGGDTTRHETEVAEICPLFARMTPDPQSLQARLIWEVSCGNKIITRSLRRVFQLSKRNTITLDIDPAVNPTIVANFGFPHTYRGHVRPHIITASFPFLLMDILTPQAFLYCREGLILHVAGEYLINAPTYRVRWLREVARTGVVRSLPNLDLCRTGVKRCQWLVLFKTVSAFRALFSAWPPGEGVWP